ncbi:hypothetical protein AAFF_G00097290 [Aldrovandia affinis]|uniref:Uncharacterized protein n=1 Tax=Aldrovandia affinis TaxID=143900 RepID=A0AAD7WC00_9TELE|nr:hypothetical protein AAFF_G00097290 [Aldrovandia affinis]
MAACLPMSPLNTICKCSTSHQYVICRAQAGSVGVRTDETDEREVNILYRDPTLSAHKRAFSHAAVGLSQTAWEPWPEREGVITGKCKQQRNHDKIGEERQKTTQHESNRDMAAQQRSHCRTGRESQPQNEGESQQMRS